MLHLFLENRDADMYMREYTILPKDFDLFM